MLHQTPIVPSASSAPFGHHHPFFSSQVVEKMEVATALKGSAQQLQLLQGGGVMAEDGAVAVAIAMEEFSVDDLFDFGAVDEGEKGEGGGVKEEEEDCLGTDNSKSSSSSGSDTSFEAPPPSEIALPAVDIAQLEWVSRIVNDSYSEFSHYSTPVPKAAPEPKDENSRGGSSSPKRTLCAFSTEAAIPVVPVKAKRSKLPRTAAGWLRPTSAAPLSDSSTTTTTTTTTSSSTTSSCSSSSTTTSSSSSCLIYEYTPGPKHPTILLLPEHPPPPNKPMKPKKRGRQPKQTGVSGGTATSSGGGGAVERRCSHCGAQKTPQWRAGPLGAKTLCNACGVRFKSGRLLPEYRPACSPTFVSHVHSNSHRKVLEMRRQKAETETDAPHHHHHLVSSF